MKEILSGEEKEEVVFSPEASFYLARLERSVLLEQSIRMKLIRGWRELNENQLVTLAIKTINGSAKMLESLGYGMEAAMVQKMGEPKA